MKVLGKTDSGFIVEITEIESRRIFDNEKVSIGMEIDIKKAYDTISAIRNLDTYNLGTAINRTKEVLDQLEEIRNTVQGFTLFHTLSTTKEN